MEWAAGIRLEFERAARARQQGNEGQARVCARRAAGIAARAYLAQQGKVVRTPSAYDVLSDLARDASLPEELRQAASLLTLRVDEAFKLPAEVDLIAEALKLCEALSIRMAAQPGEAG